LITWAEIVPYGEVLTETEKNNIGLLLTKMNCIRAEYGLPMRISSGFRSASDEKRIDPMHPNSMHTRGLACDVLDPQPESRLWKWCIAHLNFLVELGVYLEDRDYTPNHVHFQVWPPYSGSRIFKP